MLKSVEGIYRDGRIELLEPAPAATEARVIVTFLADPSPGNSSPEGPVNLAARGIDPAQAADLRARLRAFEDDWSDPKMDAYDALPPR